jgi:glucose-1-phosphate cytidylyltransferase
MEKKEIGCWPVVILCGGKGTRMWPLTSETPKPLINIGEKAALWHLMKKYSAHGHNHFILCLGHLKEKIIDYFSQSENIDPNWKIDFIDTGLDTPKSERIAKVKSLINTDNFFLNYGDDLSAVEIEHLTDFHLAGNNIVTLTSIPLYSQFGVIEIDDNHQVKQFREKPRLQEYWINGGFYICNKSVFDYLHLGDFEDTVLKNLAQEEKVRAFKYEGFWKCMNTSKDAIEFNKLHSSGEIPWKNW